MKKIALISLIFIMILSSSVYAIVDVDISWEQSSESIRPGGYSTIDIVIANLGTEYLTNVVITPSAGPDLTVTSGKISLGSLGISRTQQGTIAVKANEDAISRASYVYLDVDYYAGTHSYEKTFRIPVSITREPILQITDVKYNDMISPGKAVTLSFDVVNSGLGPAHDLIISLGQNDLYTVPESSGETVIHLLEIDSKVTISFNLVIDPDADIGIDSIPVMLSYYDETRANEYDETKYIGLAVTGDIEFITTVDDAMGSSAKITITNRGTGTAEYLTIKATSGNTVKEYYIGILDSDDSESIEFPQPKQTGNYDLELELHYKDMFGEEYTEIKIININPSFEINYTVIIILIVIVASAYWFYKKKKKK